MELDDLKRLWEACDKKLDAGIRLNTRLLHDSVFGKMRTALMRLSVLLAVDLTLLLAVMLWLGGFVWENAAEPRFLVPALTLHACVIVLVIALVRQIVAISQLDFGAPIVAIQRRLESLRVERIRAAKWTLLLAPLVGTPLLIVAFKALFDLDVYRTFGAPWVVTNVLFGVGVIAFVLWVARRHAVRLKRWSLVQRLLRDLSGHNLNAAAGFLHSLSQFEEEEPA